MLNCKNNRQKSLTVSELKKYQGFEGYSDEQAIEAIKAIEAISLIVYDLFINETDNCNTEKQ